MSAQVRFTYYVRQTKPRMQHQNCQIHTQYCSLVLKHLTCCFHNRQGRARASGLPERAEVVVGPLSSARLRQKQNGILDNPIPALDNRTPRAAANLPELRNKLIRWLKFWIFQTDTRNLETGQNVDTNWMLRELGGNEIL